MGFNGTLEVLGSVSGGEYLRGLERCFRIIQGISGLITEFQKSAKTFHAVSVDFNGGMRLSEEFQMRSRRLLEQFRRNSLNRYHFVFYQKLHRPTQAAHMVTKQLRQRM